jgi:hypothetical protein
MLRLNEFLVVALLVTLLCQISAVQATEALVPLNNIVKLNSEFENQNDRNPLGQLELPSGVIFFPWSKENGNSKGFIRQPEKEEIQLAGSQPEQVLDDLTAFNSVKERNIVYEGIQPVDPTPDSDSSMNIKVHGRGQEPKNMNDADGSFGDGIERIVDNALTSSMNGHFAGRSSSSALGQKSSMNNMNIDVSGISANAVNTAEGGSAVVNNNIIIKPVQVIVVPSGSKEDLAKVAQGSGS